MSYSLLQLPKGLTWDYKKRPKFSTIVQTPQSGRHPATATLQEGVLYDLELVFNYLKVSGVSFANDVAYLQGFYEAMRGRYDIFLFDPSQYNLDVMSVSNNITSLINGFSGIGDGVSTVFPLWRSTSALGGGFVTLCEMIQNVTLLTGVYVNGSLVSPALYTLTNFPATLTFTSPVAANATVAWAGNYSYLCKFVEDSLDFNEFIYQ